MLKQKLEEMVKTKGETYIDFSRRLLCLAREIDSRMSDGEIYRYTIGALKRDPNFPYLRFERNITELNDKLKRLDESEIALKGTPKGTTPAFRQESKSSTFVDTKRNFVPADNTRSQEIKGPNLQQRPNNPRNYSNMECMNCGELGHFFKYCRKKPLDMDKIRQKLDERKRQRSGDYWKPADTTGPIREFKPLHEMTDEEYAEYERVIYGVEDGDFDDYPRDGVETEEILSNSAQTNAKNNMLTVELKQTNNPYCRSVKGVESPVITVDLNGKKVEGLLDTGATFSIISEELGKQLRATRIAWDRPRLTTVTNEVCTPRWMFKDLRFTQLGKTITLSVGIMSRISNKLILGMDYINKIGLFIDTPRCIVGLSEQYNLKIQSYIRQILDQKQQISDQKQMIIDQNKESMKLTADKVDLMDQRMKEALESCAQTKQLVQDIISERRKNENVLKVTQTQDIKEGIKNASMNSLSISEDQTFGPFMNGLTEDIFVRNRPKKIIPKVHKEVIFPAGERKLVLFNLLDQIEPGNYLTKTLISARNIGWSVEKGVLNADKIHFRVWVQNKSSRPKILKCGDTVFAMKKIDSETIDLNWPKESKKSKKNRRRKRANLNSTQQSYDSFDRQIWERINRVPSAEKTFLTENECKLPDNDPYFIDNLDEESYKRWDVCDKMTPKQKFMFHKLLVKYRQCFAFKGDPLGQISVWEHRIDTGDHPPIKQNPYRTSELQKKQIQECVNEMMEKGAIVPCVSSWASPVTLVLKRDGSIRFCIDYRKLNAITKDDLYPIPRLDEPLTLMRGSKHFSVMDCDNCYWQIPLESESQEKTTFTCHLGTFMFKVMPFGLKSAPASCVRAMDRIFCEENRRISFIYMDDLICFSGTVEEHIRRLSILFERMVETGLKLKAKKCTFAYESVNYLGHTITVDGINPDKSRLEALTNSPTPKSVDDIRSFLGFCGFYRMYILNFSIIAESLTKLLRKKAVFEWGEEQVRAHKELIEKLINAPILAHFDPEAKTELRVDASNRGLGAHLVQITNGKRQLLSCASRTLNKHEINYSTTEKECLAIVYGLKKFRPYLYGRKFTVITDHCGLCYLMSAKDLENRLARWSLRIMDYDFDIVYNKGLKHQDADYLSRNPFKKEKSEIAERVKDSTQTAVKGTFEPILSVVRFELESEPIDFNDWSDKKTIDAQKEDPIIGPIYKLLISSDPSLQNQRRKLHNVYEIRDGVLHRKVNVFGVQQYVIYVPQVLVMQVLYHTHDSPVAGHFGMRKTAWRASQNFYWHGMTVDIRNYVRSCEECQFRKTPTTSTHSFQGSLPVPETIFHTIAIDIVGPLPTTEEGYKYIVSVTEALSKFAITYPIREASDEEIMAKLERKVFCIFGPPKVILKDQGTNLNSIHCNHVYDSWGIKSVRTTAYHPQGNGQTERFNKTLGVSLATMVPTDKDRWDDFLDKATHAYNTTINESTQYSPHELVFGWNPNVSISNKMGYRPIEKPDVLSVDQKRKHARENVLKLQLKNKQYSDQSRRTCRLEPGQLVLLFSTPLKMKKGGKLENRWIGPFRIIERLSEQTFKIINLTGNYSNVKIVNAVNLKRYYDRKDFKLHSDSYQTNP